MMREVVERVAKAIWEAHEGDLGTEKNKLRAARAAIAAMREPTRAMITAAACTEKMKAVDGSIALAHIHGVEYPKYGWVNSPMADAYRAAIDKALD